VHLFLFEDAPPFKQLLELSLVNLGSLREAE
jgi:hypothetical protein